MKVYGEDLPKTTMKSYEEIAKEVGLTLTPEMRVFGWQLHQHTLINFWAIAKRQMEYQSEVLQGAIEREQAWAQSTRSGDA